MKNDPDEIRFGCPKCKRPMSGDQALLGEMINCRTAANPPGGTPQSVTESEA